MNARTSPTLRSGAHDTPHDGARMHIARRRDGTIELSGDIDGATAPDLDRALLWHERTMDRHQNAPLVIDMREVGFIDSSGLRALVAASLRAGNRGTRIVLRNAARDVVRLLEITGLTQQFGIGADRSDGRAVNEAERRYGTDESPA